MKSKVVLPGLLLFLVLTPGLWGQRASLILLPPQAATVQAAWSTEPSASDSTATGLPVQFLPPEMHSPAWPEIGQAIRRNLHRKISRSIIRIMDIQFNQSQNRRT